MGRMQRLNFNAASNQESPKIASESPEASEENNKDFRGSMAMLTP